VEKYNKFGSSESTFSTPKKGSKKTPKFQTDHMVTTPKIEYPQNHMAEKRISTSLKNLGMQRIRPAKGFTKNMPIFAKV